MWVIGLGTSSLTLLSSVCVSNMCVIGRGIQPGYMNTALASKCSSFATVSVYLGRVYLICVLWDLGRLTVAQLEHLLARALAMEQPGRSTTNPCPRRALLISHDACGERVRRLLLCVCSRESMHMKGCIRITTLLFILCDDRVSLWQTKRFEDAYVCFKIAWAHQ